LRRSSRAIVTNLVEAYQFRSYARAFRSKLTIVDGELAETRIWLELAQAHGFLTLEAFTALMGGYVEVGRLLGAMIKHPEKYRP
jgi:four helix bundle protein